MGVPAAQPDGGELTALVVVATTFERDAVLRRLAPAVSADGGPWDAVRSGRTTVVVSGIGPAAAAAATATALTRLEPDLVLSMGICGGIDGRAAVGDVVVATGLVAADVGADSPEGFLGLADLGWAPEELPVDPALAERSATRLREAGLPVVLGPVLSVSTVTGTAERAAELAARWPAVAEAMEGRAVGEAAAPYAVPVLEVRTVSNAVGPRDKPAWKVAEALERLGDAAAVLLGEDA